MPNDTPSALVWVVAPDHPGELRAFTPFGGLYTIRGGKAWFDGEGTHLRIGGAGHEFPDLPSARAACEADYERRWREAGLVPAGEVERARANGLLEAADLAEDFCWTLTLHDKAEINEATYDAACRVQEQIGNFLRHRGLSATPAATAPAQRGASR